MNTAGKVIGTHAYFFPEDLALTYSGTSGVASPLNKPHADDIGYIDVGAIEEASDSTVKGDKLEIWQPSPGRLRCKDIITVKDQLMHKFTAKELSPLAIQAIYRTEALDEDSTQYNPLEGVPLKGWLKIQRFDHKDNLIQVVDVWVYMEATGDVDFSGGKLTEVSFEATVLHSTLNTGSLGV